MASLATTMNSETNCIFDVLRIMCERKMKTETTSFGTFSSTVLQNTSKQDATGFVATKDMSILWCSDSHGGGLDNKKYTIRDFLNSLTDEQWIEYVEQKDFHLGERDEDGKYISKLFRDIEEHGPYIDTGATLSIALITPTTIECYRVGDSPILVFRDGENILCSNHEKEFIEDIVALKQRKYFGINIHPYCETFSGVVPAPDIRPLSENVMTNKNSYYIYWDTGSGTNMTRCIGHNKAAKIHIREKNAQEDEKLQGESKTSPSPQSPTPPQSAIPSPILTEPSLPNWNMTKNIIERMPGHQEKVIVATDGMSIVSDAFDYETIYGVHKINAVDIVHMGFKRWKQVWTFKMGGYLEQQHRIPDWNRDDIAVAVWASTHPNTTPHNTTTHNIVK